MIRYDIVVVGGGVGGSVFAKAMAEQGCQILIVERTTEFKDRVRGEFLFPWGVAETKALGVYDDLMRAGGHHPKYWTDLPFPPRDYAETTPQGLRALSIYHPVMQDALLNAARSAGAAVRRGVRVMHVEPGSQPRVALDNGEKITARLVVGADGHNSTVRAQCGFETRTKDDGNALAGVLLKRVAAPSDSAFTVINPEIGRSFLYMPQAENSGRAYLGTRSVEGVRFHGESDFAAFLSAAVQAGVADAVLHEAQQAGPLATFETDHSWVDHPCRDGCVLIGDAAGATDPVWGQGLSLTMRDARELRDALLANPDWAAASHAYAAAHDRYFALTRTAVSWFTRIFLEQGAEANQVRARVFTELPNNPEFLPDTLISGPDAAPPTEAHHAAIFGAAVASEISVSPSVKPVGARSSA